MSARPSRRAATRRTAIIDSDDENDEVANATQKMAEDSEEEFTPQPTRTARRSTAGRRKTTSEAPSTPRRGRPKKSVAPTSAEPSVTFDPDETGATALDEETAPKKASPRKRKSVAPRSSKLSTPDLQPPIPTPKPSMSPEPSEVPGTPLADITNAIVNDQRRLADETVAAIKPIRPMDTILEKPMDIVLKSRNLIVPVIEQTGPKARIVITYLILTNFKSYAGTQEVGPFHTSFSSVVGPNGSGKSNVIDSLLFVFGFRASKMRQGKLSALIHNSAEHPDLEFCEVAVHFQEVMDLVSSAALHETLFFSFPLC